MNPFLRSPSAFQRTPLRAERPNPKAGKDGVVSLRLYDAIDSWGGEWGVSAKEFVTVLDELPDDTKEIRLLLNSPGGETWEGLAILNALRSHPAKVVAVVEGIAASSASFIAAGVDEVEVMPGSEIFIHRAWAGAIGNAEFMQKMSNDLAHEDRNLAAIYAGKAGGEVEDWLARMSADTFFSADEAVEAGLADRIATPSKGREDATEKAKARFDLSVFKATYERPRPSTAVAAPEAPSEVEPVTEPTLPVVPESAPEPVPELPAVEPEQPNEPKEEDPVSDLSDTRSRLDLDESADIEAINAAIDALKVKAETPVTVSDPTVEAEVEAAKAENADLRTEVDKLGQMVESMSAKLATTEAENAAKVKASVLDEAQRQGKFKPVDRKQWEDDYDDAPGVTTRLLARIKPGAEVPVNVAGVAGSPEPTDDMSTFEADMARLDGPVARKAV